MKTWRRFLGAIVHLGALAMLVYQAGTLFR